MTKSASDRSRLLYHGTNIAVRLGDKVRIKRFLRRSQEGVVCYIPGISPKNHKLEFEDVKQWAIKTSDGSVYAILYDPDNFQPPKHISFVERTNEGGITPDDMLE